jgi:hypothetical protein
MIPLPSLPPISVSEEVIRPSGPDLMAVINNRIWAGLQEKEIEDLTPFVGAEMARRIVKYPILLYI